jgi:hypothetical protein
VKLLNHPIPLSFKQCSGISRLNECGVSSNVYQKWKNIQNGERKKQGYCEYAALERGSPSSTV